MNPSQNLSELHKKALRRFSRLRDLAVQASQLPFPESDLLISYVAIEFQTTLANFTRAYYLSCILKPVLKSGVLVRCDPSITTFDGAINAAMKKCKYNVWIKGGWDRRDEPAWHRPESLIKSSQAINCSHYAQIIAAYSLPVNAFDHITKFRNFYAHRNDYTVRFAQQVANHYSISPRQHPTKILVSIAYGRPQPLILDWIDEVTNVIGFLC